MSRKVLISAVSLIVFTLVCALSVFGAKKLKNPTPASASTIAATAPATSTSALTNKPSTPSATAPTAVTPTTTGKVAPAGATVITVEKGESLPGIVHRYLPNTTFLLGSELEAAIRSANPELKGIFPKPGTQVVIPNYAPMPWTEKSVPMPRDFEVRAVYLTGTMAGSANGQKIIREWKQAGGNAVVFDIKDSDGSISVPFEHPLAPQQKSYALRNLAKFTRFVHSNGMYAIARIAIFRDEAMMNHHPEMAIRSRRTGEPWRENGKLVWTDPSRKEVQDYNIALAKYAAANGADEVQFDYVRFPAEGDQKDAKFVYESEHPNWQRADVIANFLERAHGEIKKSGVMFSLDVFGVMAWQRSVDLAHTGQDIPRMAQHCDVMSPMIYPSHFYGMDGYTMPGDAPEHFIGMSMERFAKVTAGTGVVLRPWLQAFGWRTKTYSPEYIKVQVATSKAHSGNGFLFWNARNDYSKPFAAMPDMRATKMKYYRGDEVKDFVGKTSVAGLTKTAPAQPNAAETKAQ